MTTPQGAWKYIATLQQFKIYFKIKYNYFTNKRLCTMFSLMSDRERTEEQDLNVLFLGEERLLKGALIREKTASIYLRKEERRIIVGMFAHCPPSSKWVPCSNTGEVKGGEKKSLPPYFTMPTAQDKCPSNGHSPNVRNRAWNSPFYRLIQEL